MVQERQIYLCVFGAFVATRDPDFTDPIRITSKKGFALLAYLALSPRQSATREQLAALLWGNFSGQQARQSLRQALSLLRNDLQPANVVDAGPDMVRLLPGTVEADAVEFETLSTSDAFEDLECAAGLVQGEFLAGFNLEEEGFEDWLRQKRHLFETAATGVLERYARECDRLGKGPQAIAAVERLLALSQLREDWQRLALRLYARHRGPAEALAQANVHADHLQRELEVEPEPETRALVEEIRRGVSAPAKAAAETPPVGPQAKRDVVTNAGPVLAAEARADAPAAYPERAAASTARLAEPQSLSQLLLQLLQAAQWQLVRSVTVARLAAAALLAAASILGLTYMHSAALNITTLPSRPASEAPAPVPDPWQSPRQPNLTHAEVAARRAKAKIPIVILPFRTYGEAAGSTQLLADMIADDVIHMLSRVPELRVISRSTSRTYKDQVIDVAGIGAELRVRYILDGSLRLHGGKLRVNVELIDPKTKLSVWTNRIEREGGDRHGVQDEIVGRLARELQFGLYPVESERRSKDSDADALAYRGWAAMHAAFAQSSAEAFKRAETLFLLALEREPQHTSAHMGLGAYHANMGSQRLDADPGAHFDKAWDILQDVVRRSPTNSAAHHYMGLIHQLRGNLTDAIDSFERALEFNASSATSHAHLGHTLARMGRSAEGLGHLLYAMRLSPRDPAFAYWLEFAGCSELELTHFPEAIELFRRSRALNPGYPRSLAGLVAAYAFAGNMDEARAHADKLKALAPNLTAEGLVERFSRTKGQIPRVREGLRLALNLPPS